MRAIEDVNCITEFLCWLINARQQSGHVINSNMPLRLLTYRWNARIKRTRHGVGAASLHRSSTLHYYGHQRGYIWSSQWRNYGRQWRQPPQGASPDRAPRDQCQKFFFNTPPSYYAITSSRSIKFWISAMLYTRSWSSTVFGSSSCQVPSASVYGLCFSI